jgi:hypothetical protein
MDQIAEQFEQFRIDWQAVNAAVTENPAAAAPYLAAASPKQLDEVIETIGTWLARVKAPHGFAPGFDLARALASTALAGATTASQALRRGEYAHFNSLVVALNQMLSSLHSMLIFSDRQKTRDSVAEMGGKLAESLALMNTAQQELERKTKLLSSADENLAKAQEAALKVESVRDLASRHLDEIDESRAVATERVIEIDDALKSATELRTTTATLQKESEDVQGQMGEQLARLTKLVSETESQSELIAALLPKGASAGLASAFAARVGQLERTKWIMAGTFLVSVGALIVMTFVVVSGLPARAAADFWIDLLHRIPLAAPFIWLGWFSAIQYGNTLRVQEDYAFKEATSKAFAGYKDHMEYLVSVSLKEGNTAMTLLAENTIEILAREPLRIFGHTERDVSPSHSILDALKFGSKAKAGLSE